MLADTQTAPADDLIRDTTTSGFRQDVIAESMKQPVLVDFWAPWCGPCKQLTPVIEKAVKAAGGKVKLVKMNIDEHPQIAGQLGIQSIPAVYAFQGGQPVDGFMGALPESQIKAFIERLVGPVGPGETETMLAEASALAEEGDVAGAAEIYAAILADEPENPTALAALVKLHVVLKDFEGARRFLDMVPPALVGHADVAGARAALELAESAASLGDLGDLERRVAADADDHAARFDLALGLNARDRRDQAAEHLLAIVKRDRTWNDDGARKELVKLFEAWGPMDPAAIAARKRLSSLLFA